MTAQLHTQVPADAGAVRQLRPGDEVALRALMAAHPARHCFAEARLDAGGLRPNAPGGAFWGYTVAGKLAGALLVGANLVPIQTDAVARVALAQHAVAEGRRSSSIVGPAEEVLDLWRLLQPAWGPAREVRPEQVLMAAAAPATVAADPLVRLSTSADADGIFPACVAMFTEEVGVSPLAGGMGVAYRRRIEDLIAARRSFARFDETGPVFKAELGALSRRACQIQGVWVRPALRGRGFASEGMAAVAAFAVRRVPVVSLYVNAYNTAALRAYERAGFRPLEQFATVLF